MLTKFKLYNDVKPRDVKLAHRYVQINIVSWTNVV